MKKESLFFFILCLFSACGKSSEQAEVSEKMLKVKLQFDANQKRLNNIGTETVIPAGHATLTPEFNSMSLHFIEIVPTELTPYKDGEALYQGDEVAATNPNVFGFTKAIDFEKALKIEDGETFLEIPIKNLRPGTYRHARVSVSYQNYDVKYNLKNVTVVGDLNNESGTIASFLGYNVFLNDIVVREEPLAVNDFKLQGFWAFETDLSNPWSDYNQVISGQAPSGATTVVNPFPESPIPPGSCVVAGSFEQDLTITGNETEDIQLTLSFSINKSFEWEDTNGNLEWDIDVGNPANTEKVVDMGLRGLVGKVE